MKNVHNIKLIHAIQKEQVKKVKKCIEKGFDIKERDESGATSLHYAGKSSSSENYLIWFNTKILQLKLVARTL